MKELVVISGKGGTGKTSIVASFAALAKKAVLADCDVDAADLHLVLEPQIIRRESFSGGKRARIKSGHCIACGKCEELCRFNAIYFDGPGNGRVARKFRVDPIVCDGCDAYIWFSTGNATYFDEPRNGRIDKTFRVDPIACEGCGVCAWFCAENAIEFGPAVNGEWFVSETRHGPMVHAKLGIAEENSGKLVNTVRTQARELAESRRLDMVIIDGSPGIGCPVIASITGASLVLIVTEPTLSGKHDMQRVADLAKHFDIPALLCVNKWDLNPQMAEEIESLADRQNILNAGRVRYDHAVTAAQIAGQSVVEYGHSDCTDDIREVWSNVSRKLCEDNVHG